MSNLDNRISRLERVQPAQDMEKPNVLRELSAIHKWFKSLGYDPHGYAEAKAVLDSGGEFPPVFPDPWGQGREVRLRTISSLREYVVCMAQVERHRRMRDAELAHCAISRAIAEATQEPIEQCKLWFDRWDSHDAAEIPPLVLAAIDRCGNNFDKEGEK